MRTVCLHDKDELEVFLRRNTFLHLYEIGDLDDFFWPYTCWYALKDDDGIREVALLYLGLNPPTLLAFTRDPSGAMGELLRSSRHLLPARFYAHLSEGGVSAFKDGYQVRSHGAHYKMALTNPSGLDGIDTSEVVQLAPSDEEELNGLYELSYPGNWFNPYMLRTGCYYGIRRHQQLVSVAGIHVLSLRYRVAALGNVTTRPEFRGQGLATTVCAALCRALLPTVDHIGVNVKADNSSAIACYEVLGFERIASYSECDIGLRNAPIESPACGQMR
ncbi:MAG: GNAT family N-acetyltransferase [Candidatus Eisenbacteria sp.]|nr:GNAT family N-acetyltransferase [Candidatus Eisenbacteria bacterium]